uniref:Sp4 transcription factor n=1 Tax=Naja naja TaxID=35670 RepID=A0A8C6XIN9_NAJNA
MIGWTRPSGEGCYVLSYSLVIGCLVLPCNPTVTSGQFQGVQEQSSGSSVQYQVFPQIQTTEGQHIQINPANATALQDIQGQIQLIPSGNNQAIIATTNRTSSGSIIAQNLANQTVPVQIRPGVSIPLQLPIAGTQAQVVTSLPINIERVTLALPVINVATGSSSGQVAQSTDSRLSNGNQLLSTPVTTASVSVMPDSPPPSSTTTASTSLTANEMLVTTAEAGQYAGTANSSETSTEEAQMSTSETEVQNSSHLQSNGLQNVQDQSNSLQQVPIVGQPILQQIQIQQPQQQIIQAISPQSFQLQAGQTIQAIQQQSLQNVQLQAVSPTQILIRAPTLTPSGQIIWQTVQIQNLQSLSNLQVQNAGGGTIAQIAPVALAGTPITLNTSQIASVPNLQTVSVGNLGTAGIYLPLYAIVYKEIYYWQNSTMHLGIACAFTQSVSQSVSQCLCLSVSFLNFMLNERNLKLKISNVVLDGAKGCHGKCGNSQYVCPMRFFGFLLCN